MSRMYEPKHLSTITEVSEPSHSNLSTFIGNVPISNVKIHVSDPIIHDDSYLSKHVTYLVHGEDSSGSFHVQRRYSDFQTLRNQLQNRWPGCFIPPTPPKKLYGNFSVLFIESRRTFLQMFLQQLAKITYLYTCDEFQNFIRGSADYEKSLNNLKPTIGDISIVYVSLFNDFAELEINQEINDKLVEHERFLKSSLTSLNAFKKNAKGLFTHLDSLNLQ